jgi:hypothetical protein
VKRVWALALAACLLAPAAAGAKGGVIWDRYPDVQAVGSPMKFTVMLHPGSHARPLVTFRDATTGAVVRVRASAGDLNGISYGSVALPSHGPWRTTVSVNGRAVFFEGDAEPFRVGVGLTQTIPSADDERAAAKASGAGDPRIAWLWLASAAAIGSAAVVLVMRRRGRWGAA